jgi:hypothetical protein
MHEDITCNNFFLDKNLDLKVGDFTNSKILSSLDDTSILKMEVFEFGFVEQIGVSDLMYEEYELIAVTQGELRN